jgi:hypothetical protein
MMGAGGDTFDVEQQVEVEGDDGYAAGLARIFKCMSNQTRDTVFTTRSSLV